MVFSSAFFIFVFLPILLAVYFVSKRERCNLVLLLASLWFYYYGEMGRLWILILCIFINYVLALLITVRWKINSGAKRKLCLGLSITLNLSLLGYFKYFNFFMDNIIRLGTSLSPGLDTLQAAKIALPLGISFFTFQAMSYVIDVYRGKVDASKNPLTVATYISMFPQLVAGPIVRYDEIATELQHREHRASNFSEGVFRFSIGLARKILIANTMAICADGIFALPHNELTLQLAWVGIFAYTLQIYFDFAGYSDMAIGLGLMFGFHFPENFVNPYISESIREFWQRWHVTLSRWFKDYVYIPLGGNRRGKTRTYFNLLVVFLLCGLWHGAAWQFIIWGLWHGFFLILERTQFGDLVRKSPRVIRHVYTCSVFMSGWVWFRADSFRDAIAYFCALMGSNGIAYKHHIVAEFANGLTWTMIVLGIFCSLPLWRAYEVRWAGNNGLLDLSKVLLGTSLLLLAMVEIIAGSYNPFIYFRF